MPKNVEMGVAGSLTFSLLTIAVVLLLVSFYRRYTRMINRRDDESK
jgi:hypothetical protein